VNVGWICAQKNNSREKEIREKIGRRIFSGTHVGDEHAGLFSVQYFSGRIISGEFFRGIISVGISVGDEGWRFGGLGILSWSFSGGSFPVRGGIGGGGIPVEIVVGAVKGAVGGRGGPWRGDASHTYNRRGCGGGRMGYFLNMLMFC